MMIILVSLTLIGVVAIVLVNYFSSDDDDEFKEPTIDEIIAMSFDTEEITTNLKSNEFAKIQLRIQVDNKKALSEIEKRDFQIENIIIREMSNLRSNEISGEEGIELLESQLKLRINELMQEGMVDQVYIRRIIIQ
jgi:flagellar FliL protein